MKSLQWGVIDVVVPESSMTGKYGPLEDRKCQLSILWLLCGIPVVGWCIRLERGSRQDLSQQACRPVRKGKQPSASPKKCGMWVMKF